MVETWLRPDGFQSVRCTYLEGTPESFQGGPLMKTRYSRNYHLGGPRIRMGSCLVNRPKVRRGRKSLFHSHSVSFAMRCL